MLAMSTKAVSLAWSTSSATSPTHPFLDFEFPEASEDFVFLSIALVSDTGHPLYAQNVLSQFRIKRGEPWHDLPARLAEVLIGKLGDSAVVVLPDSEGTEFCPDVPQMPVASLHEFPPVATIASRRRSCRSKQLHLLGLTSYD